MVAELWRALQAKGYKESWRTVYRLLAPRHVHPTPSRGKAEQAQAIPEAPSPDFCAKDPAWLFVRALPILKKPRNKTLLAWVRRVR